MESKEGHKIYILRGLSGSGKSTLCLKMLAEALGSAEKARAVAKEHILSTDDFFIDPVTGAYNFNNSFLHKAHLWNQARTELACEASLTPLFIDNMNLNAWMPKPYLLIAQEHDYQVEIIEPQTPWNRDPEELSKRNKHGLDVPRIRTLMDRAQWDYTLNDCLRAQIPDIYTTKEMQKEKGNWKHKLEQAKKEELQCLEDSKKRKKVSSDVKDMVSASVRIELTKNDGQKSVFKPIVVRANVKDLDEVKKLACNTFRLKYDYQTLYAPYIVRPSPKAKLFMLSGEEIVSLGELVPNMKLCISHNGANFIPMALKLTAAQKRELKKQRTQGTGTAETSGPTKPAVSTAALKNINKLPLGISTIVPDFMYIGSGRDAHTATELRENKITHVLNVATEWPDPPYPFMVYCKDGDNEMFEDDEGEPVMVYGKIGFSDTEEVILSDYLDDACDFLEHVKSVGGRVLVHCVVGKSRSAAVILAYFMKHESLTLKEAYCRVKEARKLVCPNIGFMRQLMKMDSEKRSCGWYAIDTPTTSVYDWLQTHAKSVSPEQSSSHMVWEVISKRRYFVPPERRLEFYGEIAKAVSRWKTSTLSHCNLSLSSSRSKAQDQDETRVAAHYTRDPLKIVEMSPRQKPYKLLLDLDIKMKSNEVPEEGMLGFFLNKIFDLVKEMFKQPEGFIPGTNNLESVFPGLPNFYDFSVTGTLDRFTWHQENPEIKWKYGYHLVFPNIHVTFEEHKQFFAGLIAKFEGVQNTGKLTEISPVFTEIMECNTWRELFDMTTFDPAELELRMLYTHKMFSCKFCKRRDEKKKTQKKTNKGKGKGKGKQQDHAESEQCIHCLDTGMLPSRIHKFMGVYDTKDGNLTHVPLLVEAETPKDIFQQICLASSHIMVEEEEEFEPLKKCLRKIKISDGMPYFVLVSSPDTFLTKIDFSTRYTKEHAARLFEEQLDRFRSKKAKPLQIVEWLQRNGDEQLTAKYSIKESRHQRYNNLCHFSYSQASCDFSLPLIRQCRGIILDAKNDWNVVAFPYVKFFNHGGPSADTIDWTTATVSEKIDGSIATLYWYGDAWHISTSSTADGHGPSKAPANAYDNEKLTMEELFWEIWQKVCRYTLPLDKDCSYIFEILSPRHPVLVIPKREAILLHGVRDNISYSELDPVLVGMAHGWETVPFFSFSSIDEVLNVTKHLDATKHEGYVIRDASFNRVKLKSPQYVALSQLSVSADEELNSKHMLEIIRTNEGEEFLVHFPQYKDIYATVEDALWDFLAAAGYDQKTFVDAEIYGDINRWKPKNQLESNLLNTFLSGKQKNFRSWIVTCDIEALWRVVQTYMPEKFEVETQTQKNSDLEREQDAISRKKQRRAMKNAKSMQKQKKADGEEENEKEDGQA